MNSAMRRLAGDDLLAHNNREFEKSCRPYDGALKNPWDKPGVRFTTPMKLRMTSLGPVYFATVSGTIYGRKYEWDVMTTVTFADQKLDSEWGRMLTSLAQSLVEAFDAEVFESRNL